MRTRMKKRRQVSLLVFCFILIMVVIGSFFLARSTESDQLLTTEKNIHRAIVHCYALEGAYPVSIEYLEENYGLVIDSDKYIVQYSVFGSNIMPEVKVHEKQKR